MGDSSSHNHSNPVVPAISHVVPSSSPSPESSSSPNEITLRKQRDAYNYFSRWIEIGSRFFGGIWRSAVDFYYERGMSNSVGLDIPFEVGVGNVTAAGGGLLIALIGSYFSRNIYQKKISKNNPLYRNFKTLAAFGASVGMIFSNVLFFLPNTQKFIQYIMCDIGALAFGFFAIPYWLIRHYVLKIPVETEQGETVQKKYAVVGSEGWSKYAKTFLTYGASIGVIAGALFVLIHPMNLLLSMTIASAVFSVSICILGVILVPFINKLTAKKGDNAKPGILFNKSKDVFRNNYIRSGMTVGSALFAIAGYIAGLFIPGIGPYAFMFLFAGIGSVLGGAALGVFGHKISIYMQEKWHVRENSDNSWDYASRNIAYVLALVGAGIGMFLPLPGGVLLGTMVGNAIGWFAGLFIIKKHKDDPLEKKANTAPWTQRVACGANMFAALGLCIGFGFGLIAGPAGALVGMAIGSSVGGVIGASLGALFEPAARHRFKDWSANLLNRGVDIKNESCSTTDIHSKLEIEEVAAASLTRFSSEESQSCSPDTIERLSSSEIFLSLPSSVPLKRSRSCPDLSEIEKDASNRTRSALNLNEVSGSHLFTVSNSVVLTSTSSLHRSSTLYLFSTCKKEVQDDMFEIEKAIFAK